MMNNPNERTERSTTTHTRTGAVVSANDSIVIVATDCYGGDTYSVHYCVAMEVAPSHLLVHQPWNPELRPTCFIDCNVLHVEFVDAQFDYNSYAEKWQATKHGTSYVENDRLHAMGDKYRRVDAMLKTNDKLRAMVGLQLASDRKEGDAQ